jgi:H+/gluconate symporter-like permease
MTSQTALIIIIVGIILGIPVLAYFTIWWGVAAYHRAKHYVEQCEKDYNDNNRNNNNIEKDKT